ncbi:hypothetical protein [Shouchella clausii]|uniref:hypothetical protein n=1 Tax=Shouchella clausii TaxID=79880 RepID=UPI001C733D9A|nr:hypothetical protein [Shouchella clausii]MBX0320238.1 hypothetical protein [Shouchella clausii]
MGLKKLGVIKFNYKGVKETVEILTHNNGGRVYLKMTYKGKTTHVPTPYLDEHIPPNFNYGHYKFKARLLEDELAENVVETSHGKYMEKELIFQCGELGWDFKVVFSGSKKELKVMLMPPIITNIYDEIRDYLVDQTHNDF